MPHTMIKTVTFEAAHALCELETDHRYALVRPDVIDENGQGYTLDITLRMLTPDELAAAMSFPKGYQFFGTRTDAVKQIGNAVPVATAEALCRSALEAA